MNSWSKRFPCKNPKELGILCISSVNRMEWCHWFLHELKSCVALNLAWFEWDSSNQDWECCWNLELGLQWMFTTPQIGWQHVLFKRTSSDLLRFEMYLFIHSLIWSINEMIWMMTNRISRGNLLNTVPIRVDIFRMVDIWFRIDIGKIECVSFVQCSLNTFRIRFPMYSVT